MRNTVVTEQKSQRLEDIMLFDFHVKYAKSNRRHQDSLCIIKTKQTNCNFSYRSELVMAILDLKRLLSYVSQRKSITK